MNDKLIWKRAHEKSIVVFPISSTGSAQSTLNFMSKFDLIIRETNATFMCLQPKGKQVGLMTRYRWS